MEELKKQLLNRILDWADDRRSTGVAPLREAIEAYTDEIQDIAIKNLPNTCIRGFSRSKFCGLIGRCEWCRDK